MLNCAPTARNLFFSILLIVVTLSSCKSEPSAVSSVLQGQFSQTWRNVAIGGGGYVTNVYVHPRQSNIVYAQTDNGGFYRWDETNKSWIPITDHFDWDHKNYYGGEALALDPQNPDVVLIAVGQYESVGMGTVFRSEDRGQNWQSSDLRVPMGADQNKRWAGNRLTMDPFNSKIVVFGSRRHGLWRSQDGGFTWKSIPLPDGIPDSEIGLIAIAFDPSKSGHVVLGAYGDGLYESMDSGLTWQKIDRSPTHPMRLAIASDGTLYVTSDRTPGISRYSQRQWQDITPPQYQGKVFNGLTVHPTKPDQLIASIGEDGSAEIFYTENAGTSWIQPRHKITNTVSWLPDQHFRDHTSAIQYSPSAPNEVWLSDWFGIWKTEDVQANPIHWQNYTQGHEQVVVFSLIAPSEGALLLSGVADVNGFRHQDLDQFPAERLGTTDWLPVFESVDQDTYSLSYSANHPQELVRVGGKRWQDRYGVHSSKNGGLSWTSLGAFPSDQLPLRVAVSASQPQNFVVVVSEDMPYVTVDGGQTWTQSQGLPPGPKGPWTWVQPLAADGGNGDRYFYYSAGTLFRSDNRGISFRAIQTALPNAEEYQIQTMPGLKDWLWLRLGSEGLYVSSDAGLTFRQITSVAEANLFTVGIGSQDGDNPIWYLYGTAMGKTGVLMSTDQGTTWSSIHETQVQIGAQPRIMEASKQHLGLIFIGTNGRGIYYKQVRP